MKKSNLIKMAMVAALGLAATQAMALQGDANVTINNTLYAAENFPGAANVQHTTVGIVIRSIPPTVAPAPPAPGFTFLPNQTFALKLSGTATWGDTCPLASIAGAVVLTSLRPAPDATKQICTYTIDPIVVGNPGDSITLGGTAAAIPGVTAQSPFTISNVSALQTPLTSIAVTVTSQVNGAPLPPGVVLNILNNGNTTIASSAQALTSTSTANNANTQLIDIANSGEGKKWRVGSTNQAFGQLGTFNFALNGFGPTDVSGVTAFNMVAGDVPSVTISGPTVPALKSVYLSTTACSETAPATLVADPKGSNSATITGTNVSIAAGQSLLVCGIANGSLIPAGQVTGSGTVAYASRNVGLSGYVPTSIPATAANSTLVSMSYNGNAPAVQSYFTGVSGGFNSYLRVNNNSTLRSVVYISVTMDDGKSYFATLDAELPANTSKLYTAANINEAVKTEIFKSATDRARIQVLTSVTQSAASTLLGNPGGTVTVMPAF